MNIEFKPCAPDVSVEGVGVLLLAFRAGSIAAVVMVSVLLHVRMLSPVCRRPGISTEPASIELSPLVSAPGDRTVTGIGVKDRDCDCSPDEKLPENVNP